MNEGNKELYNYLFENEHAVILIIHPDNGQILDANKAACDFYGYTHEEIKLLNIKNINVLPPEAVQEEMKKAQAKTKKVFLFKHILKNGEIRDVEVLSGPISTDDQKILVSIIIDRTQQKKLEEVLQIFKKAVDSSGEIMFMTDYDGVITYINPEFTKIYGYESEEIINKATPRILKNGILRELNYAELWNTLKGGKLYKGEFLNKTKNGQFINIEASINPIWDNNGQITRFLAIQKDITERKSFEKSLIENEQRFRRIFEDGPLGMAIIGFDLRVKAGNAKFAEIYGYEFSEVQGLSVDKIISPDQKIFIPEIVNGFIKGEVNNVQKNNRYYKRNGEIIWVNITVSLIKDNNGSPLYFLIMVEDINEKVLADEKIKLSVTRYRTLAANIPNSLVLLYDSELNCLLAEGDELERLGITKQQLEGKSVSNSLSVSIIEKIKDQLFSVFNGKEQECELEVKNQIYEIHFRPVKTSEGSISNGLLVAFNITERKNIERQLKELNSNKDKFFSIIAHDLRSPFNSLLGLSDFIANEYDQLTDEQIRTFSMNINKVAKAVFALLENLLHWSMFQTGKLEFSPSRFKIDALVQEIVEIYKINAMRKNITLKTNSSEEVYVYADRNMIFTVLRNLVSNAIKFTDERGEVGIIFSENDDNIKITIYDNGVGITPEDMTNLFRMDKNISRIGTDNEKGTGLGLILCREFIEKNSGQLLIESSLNNGTTCTINLPAGKML